MTPSEREIYEKLLALQQSQTQEKADTQKKFKKWDTEPTQKKSLDSQPLTPNFARKLSSLQAANESRKQKAQQEQEKERAWKKEQDEKKERSRQQRVPSLGRPSGTPVYIPKTPEARKIFYGTDLDPNSWEFMEFMREKARKLKLEKMRMKGWTK